MYYIISNTLYIIYYYILWLDIFVVCNVISLPLRSFCLSVSPFLPLSLSLSLLSLPPFSLCTFLNTYVSIRYTELQFNASRHRIDKRKWPPQRLIMFSRSGSPTQSHVIYWFYKEIIFLSQSDTTVLHMRNQQLYNLQFNKEKGNMTLSDLNSDRQMGAAYKKIIIIIIIFNFC